MSALADFLRQERQALVGFVRRRRGERRGRRFRGCVPGTEPDAETGPDGAPMPGNGRRWHQFRRYWRDEGRAAFDSYVQKTKPPQDEK